MSCDLRETQTSGVWLEFRDEHGHTQGQAVLSDWNSRPLPAVGDCLTYVVPSADNASRELSGCVASRTFDIQHDDAGLPCVWAHLVVVPRQVCRSRPSREPAFSQN